MTSYVQQIRPIQSYPAVLGDAANRKRINGKIPTEHLAPIPSHVPNVPFTVAAGYALVKPAARAWNAMEAHARREGITLKPVGAYGTTRPFAEQVRLFVSRYAVGGKYGGCKWWSGFPPYSAGQWCKKADVATAATPGNSNHGLGLAVDVGTELDGDAGPESIDRKTLTWLEAHAWDYGFAWELASENWHVRWCLGDGTTGAIDAHYATPAPPVDPEPRPLPLPTPEPGPAPVPQPPQQEDEDMRLVRKDGKDAIWATNGLQRRHVGHSSDVEQLQALFGVTVVVVPGHKDLTGAFGPIVPGTPETADV